MRQQNSVGFSTLANLEGARGGTACALAGALVVALALAPALIGCGSGEAPPAGDPDANTEPPAEMYQLAWGPITVQPGEEGVKCVTVPLGNTVEAKIKQITNVLGSASHHLIVYTTNETTPQTTPTTCDSIENLVNPDKGLPLMITQKAEETLTMPKGVAFVLPANQMLRLELHYINTTDAPLEVKVDSTLIPMADAEFEFAADLLFIGNPDLDIPANSTATLGPTFMSLSSEFGPAKFFGVTGHTHQWGTSVVVDTADLDGTPIERVYAPTPFLWSEPETVLHDPPFTVPEFGGFSFTCTWDNQSPNRLGFGESANDEMCFFWTYYYPSVGARTCFHTEQAANPLDVCCPGHQLCNLILDWYRN